MNARQTWIRGAFSTAVVLTALLGGGCAAGMARMEAPAMEPLFTPAAIPPLVEDHFKGDKSGTITEAALRRVLAAPAFLAKDARIGVVQVVDRYDPDAELPLTGTPAVLGEELARTGLFEVTTEVSTDWPADRGIAGLRELAARYRSEYLLLYRHRFRQERYTNAWAWLCPTLVGLFVAPAHTLEAAGVLEATLFDVQTGTILFTVFTRVHERSEETVFQNERKWRELKSRMLEQAAGDLAAQVVAKTRRLAAARLEGTADLSRVGSAANPSGSERTSVPWSPRAAE